MARAANTSDRMLLYYFADKDALMAAALGRVAERLTAMLADIAAPAPLPLPALTERLAGALLDARFWPYMRLWLAIAARAAHGDKLYMSIGESLGRGFLAWGRAQLDSADPDGDAARLLTNIEGMVLLKSIGLGDVAMRGITAD
ncbi:MAG: hypothetical protein MUF41_06935 [Sphingopyxis sp.]|nr:hypothetical protein [Sphingopyxis sp.]